jgi:hypothetical protein
MLTGPRVDQKGLNRIGNICILTKGIFVKIK